MAILSIKHLFKTYDEYYLFKDISFNILKGEKVALIGENGTGKSTLLKIVLGNVPFTKDKSVITEINMLKSVKLGYLSQNIVSNHNNTLIFEMEQIYKNLLNDEHELRTLESLISQNPNNEDLINKYAEKAETFQINNGYGFRNDIHIMLSKFGFNKDHYDRKISAFSGGEQVKIAFCKLLLMDCDFLILDEPTNHLDITTIEWLESYLKKIDKTILFVSHDRELLNNISTKILELDNQQIEEYKGDFDFYINEKQVRYETKLKQFKVLNLEKQKMEKFINYYRKKPRFASRVQDRKKKLNNLGDIVKPTNNTTKFKLNLSGGKVYEKLLLKIESGVVGYDKPLAKNINFDIYSTDKIALIGSNGVGKTTLIKTLLGEVPLISGDIYKIEGLKISYLAQCNMDFFIDETVGSYFHRHYPNKNMVDIRTYLGKFHFTGDDINKLTNSLSGGEKTRLVLAKILFIEFDLLILDEPTNNLDLVSKEALVDGLLEYNKSLIFISHDRYFVDKIANKILHFKNNETCLYFEDGYKEYRNYLLGKPNEVVKHKEKLEVSVDDRLAKKEDIRKQKEKQRALLKLESRLENISEELKRIGTLEEENEQTTDYVFLTKLYKEKDKLEEEYFEVLETIEKINDLE